MAGGMVSSASAIASAASLVVQGGVSPQVAGVSAVLASLASAFINLPLRARIACNPRLTAHVGQALVSVLLVGLIGAALQLIATPLLPYMFPATLATR